MKVNKLVISMLLVLGGIYIVGCWSIRQPKTEEKGKNVENGLYTNAEAIKNIEKVNPMKQVSSSADFATIGIKLELPGNKSWYQDPTFHIIDGKIAQIQFRDTGTNAKATTRGGALLPYELAGIYTSFDLTKNQNWFTIAKDKKRIPILVQVAMVENERKGILASWSYEGINYTLWEETVECKIEEVAKLAREIATMSSE